MRISAHSRYQSLCSCSPDWLDQKTLGCQSMPIDGHAATNFGTTISLLHFVNCSEQHRCKFSVALLFQRYSAAFATFLKAIQLKIQVELLAIFDWKRLTWSRNGNDQCLLTLFLAGGIWPKSISEAYDIFLVIGVHYVLLEKVYGR